MKRRSVVVHRNLTGRVPIFDAATSVTAPIAASMCASVLNGPMPNRTAPWSLSVPICS